MAMPKGRTTGLPNQRRLAVALTSASAWSPGARFSTAGVISNRILASGSMPIGVAETVVLPVFSTCRPNRPVRPQTTVIGARATRRASLAGTTSSISATAMACGGVTSRTWTAIRRSPAPRPAGIRMVARTSCEVSGNSERFSASNVTHDGSAPRMRRW